MVLANVNVTSLPVGLTARYTSNKLNSFKILFRDALLVLSVQAERDSSNIGPILSRLQSSTKLKSPPMMVRRFGTISL